MSQGGTIVVNPVSTTGKGTDGWTCTYALVAAVCSGRGGSSFDVTLTPTDGGSAPTDATLTVTVTDPKDVVHVATSAVAPPPVATASAKQSQPATAVEPAPVVETSVPVVEPSVPVVEPSVPVVDAPTATTPTPTQ